MGARLKNLQAEGESARLIPIEIIHFNGLTHPPHALVPSPVTLISEIATTPGFDSIRIEKCDYPRVYSISKFNTGRKDGRIDV